MNILVILGASGGRWRRLVPSPPKSKKQFGGHQNIKLIHSQSFKAWLIIEVFDLILSRALLLPWLLLYGAGIVACLASHLYFTRCQYHQGEFKNTKIGIFAQCVEIYSWHSPRSPPLTLSS